ncbi:MAG: CDP-diacylglycerol--serine O-phosphatidyltransferase [Deltaproteobacteria bacterium]|nr:MAG: CDP-diacylglycerol--serine O-phosphatidyltransferase [Deltaproteobacteria bacterium]
MNTELHSGGRPGLRRGVYLLPNLFTTGGLFAGFYSIISTIHGNYDVAAWFILIATVFDGLDGRVARMTNTTSRFGVEYDSLADLVAFGVAPGVLMYMWALRPFGKLGWLAAFLYVVCGALRLARFNVQINTVESKRFLGLPIPAAAGMVASCVLLFYYLGGTGTIKKVSVLLLIYGLAFLMVSSIRYYSFKDPELVKRQPFGALVLVIFLVIVVIARPEVMLFSLGLVYVASGPLGLLFGAGKGEPKEESSDQVVAEVNEENGASYEDD